MSIRKVYYHLPGLFEFYDFYEKFLPLYRSQRHYFYDWCEIGSIYGSPADCIWSGGRISYVNNDPDKVFSLVKKYNISARLTFSNSMIRQEHFSDLRCNELCRLLSEINGNGVIVHSDVLLEYLKEKYPNLYFVSSTTKVLVDFNELIAEVNRDDFSYVVIDFRLNKAFAQLETLNQMQKDKVEFLCNECCWIGCKDRKKCYETVSRQNLGIDCADHVCKAPHSNDGYRFSKAMENPSFISKDDILQTYVPMGIQ